MRAQIIACLVLTVFASFDPQATVSADELVKFDSAAYGVGKLQQQRARERGEMPTGASATTIEGYLSKPDGSGPFAAVVYLHGCDGLSENERKGIAKFMTGWGYVSLAVDSFATRGIKDPCTQPVTGVLLDRQGDALGALSYLSNLPFVDPQRIATVGASQGGMVALEIASTHPVDIFAIPDGLKFKAAVAYYPLCSVATQTLSIPTVILIGELDDWTPSKNCEQWMALRAGEGAPVKLVIYPGAYHTFTSPAVRDGMRYLGHWLKYDADATQRSLVEMHDFLATELAK